jgi:hypothetical protein
MRRLCAHSSGLRREDRCGLDDTPRLTPRLTPSTESGARAVPVDHRGPVASVHAVQARRPRPTGEVTHAVRPGRENPKSAKTLGLSEVRRLKTIDLLLICPDGRFIENQYLFAARARASAPGLRGPPLRNAFRSSRREMT